MNRLTQMLLDEFPSLRQDSIMMRSYMFLLDFLEAVGKETTKMLRIQQNNLRQLLEASKVSEDKLNEHIIMNKDKVIFN